MMIATQETRKIINQMLSDYVHGNLICIVRCKNCEYFSETEIADAVTAEVRIQPFCMKHGMDIHDDWFCADGKAVRFG